MINPKQILSVANAQSWNGSSAKDAKLRIPKLGSPAPAKQNALETAV
jgi:hypothetical protein